MKRALGFEGVDPAATGRPAYHPAVLLKIYIYGKAIRSVCRQFVVLCRNLNFFSQSIIAIDGSKFKTVNNRERNFTQGIVKARMSRPSLIGQALTPLAGGYLLQTWGAGGVLAGLSSLAMLNVILVLFLLQLVRKR